MSDELTTESVAPKVKAKAAKKNFYKDKADKLAAEVAQLKTQLAVKDHFEEIDGYKDEHDRAHDKHRALVEEAKTKGIDHEEIIENNLDRTALHMEGERGKSWIRANRCKWVNRTARDGTRIAEHEGRGFAHVRPNQHPVRPVAGIKRDNTWILGDLILMFEPMAYYEKRRRQSLQRMLEQGGMAREATRDQINKLIRDESGQPSAQPGLTKSYRDNTWDKLTEEAPIQGPSAHTISPTA